MSKVFISHCSADRDFVESEIVQPLNQAGIDTWYCKHNVDSGRMWQEQILQGLQACDTFLVVMTESALESRWVRAEVDWWIDERLDQTPGSLIPLLVEPCDWKSLHLMLRSIQFVDFQTRSPATRAELLKACGVEQMTFQPHGRIPLFDQPVDSVFLSRIDDPDNPLTSVCAVSRGNVAQWYFSRRYPMPSKIRRSEFPGPAIPMQSETDVWLLLPTGELIICRPHQQWAQKQDTKLPKEPLVAELLDENLIAAGYENGEIWASNLSNASPLPDDHAAQVTAVAASRSSAVFSAAANGEFFIRSLQEGHAKIRWPADGPAVRRISTNKGRRDEETPLLCCGYENGDVKVFELRKPIDCTMTETGNGPVRVAKFLATELFGPILLSADAAEVRIWSATDWRLIAKLQPDGFSPITAAALMDVYRYEPLADGHWATCTVLLALGHADGGVSNWTIDRPIAPVPDGNETIELFD